MLVSFKTNFRLYLLVTSMLLAGCISIQSTAPEDRTSQVDNQSLDEIQSLKEEVKSLRELLAKGSKEGIEQINPRSTNEDLNYELIERVLRETSEVASQPEVVFVRPAKLTRFNYSSTIFPVVVVPGRKDLLSLRKILEIPSSCIEKLLKILVVKGGTNFYWLKRVPILVGISVRRYLFLDVLTQVREITSESVDQRRYSFWILV